MANNRQQLDADNIKIRHQRIVEALLGLCQAHSEAASSPYVREHLAAHVAAGQAWQRLTASPDLLDRLNPNTLAAELLRTQFARHDVPSEIIASAADWEALSRASVAERSMIRAISMARFTESCPESGHPLAEEWRWGWARVRRDAPSVALSGHRGIVRAIATIRISDTGLHVASGGEDGTVRLWDPMAGRQVGEPLTGHSGPVNALAVATLPDRQLLASGGEDGVHLWNPAARLLIGSIEVRHEDWHFRVLSLTQVEFPDGRSLLACGTTNDTICLLDPVACKVVAETGGHGDWVNAVTAIRLGDEIILAGGSDYYSIDLWDVPETMGAAARRRRRRWVSRAELLGHTDAVTSLAFMESPDGQAVLFSGGWDGIKRWNPSTASEIGGSLFARSSGVQALCPLLLDDGRRLLVSGGIDGTVRLWDPFPSVSESRDGEIFDYRSMGDDIKAATVVGLGSGRRAVAAVLPLKILTAHGGEHASYRGEGIVALFDCTDGHVVAPLLAGHVNEVVSVVRVDSQAGTDLVATYDWASDVRLWTASTGSQVGSSFRTSYANEGKALAFLRLREASRALATAGQEGIIRLWSIPGGHPIGKPIQAHGKGEIRLSTLRQPGQADILVSGGGDGSLRLWDPDIGSPIGRPLEGHTGTISALHTSWSPNSGTMLVSGGSDGTIRRWDPSSQLEVGSPLVGHLGSIRAVNSIRGWPGEFLVSGGEDRTLRLWDFTRGLLSTHSLAVEIKAIEVYNLRVFLACDVGLIAIDLDASWRAAHHIEVSP